MDLTKNALMGYDKDADVYETLCVVPHTARLLELAHIVTDYHLHQNEIRRTKTGEPFDWFAISDENGDIRNIFTAEFPNGRTPF